MSHDSSGTRRRRLSGTRGGASGDRPAQPGVAGCWPHSPEESTSVG